MTEHREVTRRERQQMTEDGVFDINGNISAHPGYTGIHKRKDGKYYYRGDEVTDPKDIYAIDHRNDEKPIEPRTINVSTLAAAWKEIDKLSRRVSELENRRWWQFWGAK